MRRNDVCLFFAKIRSTTQTANTSTALNEPPSSLSHSATRSSFSLLESDSFLEIHCAFYRHRVFGEFSNQFSFFFCFRFYCLGFGVHIHFAYTHIWRIFIFSLFSTMEKWDSGRDTLLLLGVDLLFYDTKSEVRTHKWKTNWTDDDGDGVGKSSRVNSMDYANHFFLHFFLLLFRCISFSCLCFESMPGYGISSVAFSLLFNSKKKKKRFVRTERRMAK